MSLVAKHELPFFACRCMKWKGLHLFHCPDPPHGRKRMVYTQTGSGIYTYMHYGTTLDESEIAELVFRGHICIYI